MAANKADLYSEEEVDEELGRQLGKDLNAVFRYTSALNASGVNDLFNALAEKFIEGDNVLIVADLPFTPDFEAKVVNEINRLRTVFKDFQVYRKDIHVEKVKS